MIPVTFVVRPAAVEPLNVNNAFLHNGNGFASRLVKINKISTYVTNCADDRFLRAARFKGDLNFTALIPEKLEVKASIQTGEPQLNARIKAEASAMVR